MKLPLKKIKVKRDTRGWFAEIIRPEDIHNPNFGQVSISTALPGETKGNHYHKRKTEWYCVIQGKGLLTLVNNSTKERIQHKMSEENMALIEIPPNYFHAISNIGNKKMYLLIYIDEPFDEANPDTYYE